MSAANSAFYSLTTHFVRLKAFGPSQPRQCKYEPKNWNVKPL